ncbi:hypothetical protein CYMTET_42906 [Cymbomonas tetramitiformis]|uniref:Uncharacterized protein n=1 Tax=Cymbomonas tetramitiformis TaxID=36881 RepID=A0AAE0F163_9CHLO|nr:hypothetical protein CYMTET_42906 [Cymbomonas tetramitiformis]|eukprot:gene27610-34069_t
MWKDFAVKLTPLPTPGGERGVQKYLHFVKVGACAGDEACYTYMLDWMAHAVQNQWAKPEVAIILFGGQRDGKGVVIREFAQLFGKHFQQVAHSRHFTGHFNAMLSDCILLFIHEAVNNPRDAHIVMWPIENADRRVHLMKVSSLFNRNYVFFKELCNSMDEGGREYLVHILQIK